MDRVYPMSTCQTYEGVYRVVDFDTEGEFLLLYDTERDERVWVNRNGYDKQRQPTVGRLRPGYLIRGIVVGEPGVDAPWNFEHVEVLTHTTFATTKQVATLPTSAADDVWEQHDGDRSVVTSVTDETGKIVYELELFPNNYQEVNFFEKLNTGEWPVEPWFDSLPITERAPAHLLLVSPQERPYVAVIGFLESHPAYDQLLDRLRIDEADTGADIDWESSESPSFDPVNKSSEREAISGSTASADDSPSETNQAAEAYSIGRVEVTPASSDDPGAYHYSDLQRFGAGDWRVRILHHVYWPTYLLFVFPIQYLIRAVLWQFWDTRYGPVNRFVTLLSEGFANLRKLSFLIEPNQRTVYLRASRAYTPTQLIPMLPGTTPIKEDPTSDQPPRSENWGEIRKAVYRRDNYHCTNCASAGGPHGDTELHADHVLPRSRGGSDTLPNLRTLCRSCHQARHARLFE